MSEEIGPCRHCGCIYTYVNAQARGAVQVHYDETGSERDVAYDELFFHKSHVVRCEDCLKIRRDLEVDPAGGVRLKDGKEDL